VVFQGAKAHAGDITPFDPTWTRTFKGVANMTAIDLKHSRFWLGIALSAICLVAAVSAGAGHAAEGCTTATLHDSYGFQLSGVFIPSAAETEATAPDDTRIEIAATGRMIFDGRGQVSAAYTESFGGTIIPGGGTGSYSVQPDCTGSLSLTENGRTTPLGFTIVERGEKVMLLVTEPGGVALGTASRQGKS